MVNVPWTPFLLQHFPQGSQGQHLDVQFECCPHSNKSQETQKEALHQIKSASSFKGLLCMINKPKEMMRCNVTFHLISKSTQNKDFLIQVTLPKFPCHSSVGEENKSFKNLEAEELM